MQARVITFSVQLGSDGFRIARQVAEGLQLQYYDWEVTSRAAADAHVSEDVIASAERMPSIVQRLVEGFTPAAMMAGDPPVLYQPSEGAISSTLRALSSDAYRHLIEGVVEQIAERGNALIVGHAGQVILRPRRGVLKILVCGSPESRAEELGRQENLSPKQAKASIERSDKERLNFLRHFYHENWLDPALYDLTINTDRISLERAAGLVFEAARL